MSLNNVKKSENYQAHADLLISFSSKCKQTMIFFLFWHKKTKERTLIKSIIWPHQAWTTHILNLLFYSLWETCQTLFWAIFGLIDLENFELTGIKEFSRFTGLLMFGSFSVINVIVLLNLLIAMMNHSYQLISVSSVSRN